MRTGVMRRILRRAGHAVAVLGVLSLAATHSVDAQGIGLKQLKDMMGWGRELFVLTEVLEYAPDGPERPIRYDLLAWYGGAYNRVWAKVDGKHGTRNGGGDTELQLLYGRLISPWWDAQIGLDVDVRYGEGNTDTRASLAVGVEGLAPGWFEVEPTLFVSQHGDISAKLTASYDMLFTQRLVLQPRLETSVAVQEVPEFGVGSGFNDIELGARMRYEIRRELAPYVGVLWVRQFGGTADLARTAGEPVGDFLMVAGLRLWR